TCLQTTQNTNNNYSIFKQSLLQYITTKLNISYKQLSQNYTQINYSTTQTNTNKS
ncbi:phage portal protein, partial [Klebsiella pneumoniae]|uniref:phage portal protein n=1 Tax=Klebsiella pneumoniae TaxID=573 RepID=UPI003B59F606